MSHNRTTHAPYERQQVWDESYWCMHLAQTVHWQNRESKKEERHFISVTWKSYIKRRKDFVKQNTIKLIHSRSYGSIVSFFVAVIYYWVLCILKCNESSAMLCCCCFCFGILSYNFIIWLWNCVIALKLKTQINICIVIMRSEVMQCV